MLRIGVRRVVAGFSGIVIGIVPGSAAGGEVYANEQLSFQTKEQSMWSSGDGFVFDWSKEFLTPQISTGSVWIDPGPITNSGVTVDTRFAFSAAGRMGVGAGFYLTAGHVDANLDFDVSLSTPDAIGRGEFFAISGDSTRLGSSQLKTYSPTARTYLEGIIQFYTNYFAEAKVSGGNIFNGVSNGTFRKQRDHGHGGPLIDVDKRLDLIAFNHGGNGRLVWKAQDVGGTGDVVKIGNPLAPSAEITVGHWEINTTGSLSGNALRSSGSTNFFSALIDVDAALSGGSPLFGAGINTSLGPNIDFHAYYDVLDFDNIFDVGYRQQFALDSRLKVKLTFSEEVAMKDASGNVTRGTETAAVAMGDLPEIALLGGSVEVTPEFMVSADLSNQTDLTLDVRSEFNVLRGGLDIDFHSTFYNKEDMVNRSFGPAHTDEQDFGTEVVNVYDERFGLGGFQVVRGRAFTLTASSAASVWAVDADGDWDDALNWHGVVPGLGGSAVLPEGMTAPRTIVVDELVNLSELKLSGTHGYDITDGDAGGGIALSPASDPPAPPAQLTVTGNGSHRIEVVWFGETDVSIDGGGTLEVYEVAVWEDETVVRKTGDGLLKFSAGHVLRGPARFEAHGGTTDFVSLLDQGDHRVDVSVMNAGAEVVFTRGQTMGALDVAAGKARVRDSATFGTLRVTGVDVGAEGQLDLNGDALRVVGGAAGADGGEAALRAVTELLRRGRNGGETRWDGNGITSTLVSATPLMTLAAGISGDDVIVIPTYDGDANLDGRINADDYFRIDSGFLDQPADPLYAQGDFNYDGTINADDYFLIDSAFLGQTGPAAAAFVSVVAAPEPGVGFAALAWMAVGLRRRRRDR
jgi:hypothetical protein